MTTLTFDFTFRFINSTRSYQLTEQVTDNRRYKAKHLRNVNLTLTSVATIKNVKQQIAFMNLCMYVQKQQKNTQCNSTNGSGKGDVYAGLTPTLKG